MSSFFALFGVSWEAIDEKIANEYPSVSHLEGADLHSLYAGTDIPQIIDVRTAEEFAVSHLIGARNMETADAIATAIPDSGTPVIVYCSVGYRSAGVAEDLENLGYSNVKNLRHSIFSWAEQGFPLVDEHGATSFVHPYNRIWGTLVSRSLHAYQPSSGK